MAQSLTVSWKYTSGDRHMHIIITKHNRILYSASMDLHTGSKSFADRLSRPPINNGMKGTDCRTETWDPQSDLCREPKLELVLFDVRTSYELRYCGFQGYIYTNFESKLQISALSNPTHLT